MTTAFVLLSLAAFAWAVWIYNRLVRDRNLTLASWSDIGVQLKRRHDLVPKLVDAVRAYATYESARLEEVTRLRAEALAATRPGEAARAERSLGARLAQVIAIAEAYPDLKASANFVALQQELGETEDQLAFARQYYNDAAASLNTAVATFPWMVFSGMAAVHKREFYEAPDAHQAPPQVAF